ncbi:MAG: PTS system mannose/fructose/sorbose family transporter subunit IID [Candidatus Riflebacteria bacterium]|nr:PTS system mannose/fructose/sorbose family transporter subunit IID [Candidatus Riflebacteria bacterium]
MAAFWFVGATYIRLPVLSNALLLRIAFRSFFLQASWNFRGMMNMGLLYSLKPGLDEIYADPELRASAYRRHLDYFNTNPYFSSILMGVLLFLEEKLATKEIAEDIMVDTKEGLMTAFAAVGDSFFWDSWRPFVATLAVLLAFNNLLFTPILFLLIYNIPHLYLRFFGIFWGYRMGPDVIRILPKFQMQKLRPTLRFTTLALLCFLIPNFVNLHTPFLITFSSEYFFLGEKIVQGFGACLLVGLAALGYKAGIDVLMISFLLMVVALLFHHWGILI